MDTNPITESGGPAPEKVASTGAAPHEITRRAVVSWVLYDLANSIISMGVISLHLPLWIRDAGGQEKAGTLYGLIRALSMALIFFASPLLGAMTDRPRRRMPFLIGSTVISVCFTAL